MATVYAVASAKGGVGKTTTTAAIATILADSGADVVAIDADIGMANLAAAVGVTPGETTLHDVLAGEAAPLDAVHEGPAGLRVVPGAAELDAYATADPSILREVVSAFDDADYVFVDAGAGLSHDSTLPLGLADETLLVSTAERSALGDTEKTRQLTERLGGAVAGAAITRVSGDAAGGEADEADAVAELLGALVLGRIPEDEAVVRAAEAKEPLPLFAPHSPATRGYRDLTRALTGADIAGDGLAVGGHSGGEVGDESDEADDESDDQEGVSDDEDETEESSDDESETTSVADEDIIIADSEQAGLGDPGDEEEIIVADESPVEADDETGEIDDDGPEGEPAPTSDEPENGVTDETELVGEEHVDGDDLEAMIAEDIDGTAAFDEDEAGTGEYGDDRDTDEGEQTAEADEDGRTDETDERGDDSIADADDTIADADEVASQNRERGDQTDAIDDGETDIDDELAGSVPFRDDDTGTMNTVLTGEDAENDDQQERGERGSGDGGSDRDTDEADDDDKKSGGFLSRLFGR